MPPTPDFGQPGANDNGMVASPCIDVCKMNAGLCAGCMRTIDEIARWSRIGDDEKRLIIAAVAQRRGERGPESNAATDEAA